MKSKKRLTSLGNWIVIHQFCKQFCKLSAHATNWYVTSKKVNGLFASGHQDWILSINRLRDKLIRTSRWLLRSAISVNPVTDDGAGDNDSVAIYSLLQNHLRFILFLLLGSKIMSALSYSFAFCLFFLSIRIFFYLSVRLVPSFSFLLFFCFICFFLYLSVSFKHVTHLYFLT